MLKKKCSAWAFARCYPASSITEKGFHESGKRARIKGGGFKLSARATIECDKVKNKDNGRKY